MRHFGAWAVKKVVEQRRKYAKENVFSSNTVIYKSALESHDMCLLFEDHVIETRSHLKTTTKYPGTLAVTKDKQIRRMRSLLKQRPYVFNL